MTDRLGPIRRGHTDAPRKLCLYLYLLLLPLILCLSAPASGTIAFEEVTKKAGISLCSPTAGAAWGDFNGDGRPDLWVVNHYLFPSLYVNQKDGTFSDVADSVLHGRPVADYHGAAWADFDNDGDQDLLNLTGGGAGRGQCPNYLFINQDGVLKDQAKPMGIDYPFGRGRTPVWFDADRDGRLDVLVVNKPRDGQAPTALFRQDLNGFQVVSREFGFRLGPHSTREKIMALADNAFHLRFRRGPGKIMTPEFFAQLADLSGDGTVDLVAYTNPMRVFSIDTVPFKEITNQIGFPRYITGVLDVAIEDFNGDLQFDMYLARSNPWASSVVQRDTHTVIGALFPRGTPLGIQFRSEGNVNIGFYTPWKDPSDPLRDRQPAVFLGAAGQQVNESSISLSPADRTVWGPVPEQTAANREISIDYDVAAGLWTLRTSYHHLDFTLTSTAPVEQMKTLGFTTSQETNPDKLIIQSNGHFTDPPLFPVPGSLIASRSVAAADFDNDMDMDIYLVRSGSAGNMPNLLLENDGRGNFSVVPLAGGAEGSDMGRGESVVVADFDRDGFLDLFVTNGGGFEPIAAEGPHQLFRNKGNSNHWLELDFQGTTSNRDGIGVHIMLMAGGIKQVRTQNGGMHYMAQHHQRVHFGLGKHTVADELVVRWPSGKVQRLENVRADQILLIREPN